MTELKIRKDNQELEKLLKINDTQTPPIPPLLNNFVLICSKDEEDRPVTRLSREAEEKLAKSCDEINKELWDELEERKFDTDLSKIHPPLSSEEPIVERCVRLGLLDWVKHLCDKKKYFVGYGKDDNDCYYDKGVYGVDNCSLLTLAAKYGHKHICEYIIQEWDFDDTGEIHEASEMARNQGFVELAEYLEKL